MNATLIPRRSRRGAVLIVVLVVVAMLSLAGYTFTHMMLTHQQAAQLHGRNTEQQRSLNLRRRADDLIKTLRADIGEHFLRGVRVVMAYRVHNSAFISSYTYACNFLRAGGRGPHTWRM